jgi:hypothetical protein
MRLIENLCVLRLWPTRRTGRAAINARGADSIDKLAVSVRIALQHSLPARVVKEFVYAGVLVHGFTFL